MYICEQHAKAHRTSVKAVQIAVAQILSEKVTFQSDAVMESAHMQSVGVGVLKNQR